MKRSFPALGFDPAPGDPVAVRQAALTASRAAATLSIQATDVSSTDAATWSGAAAAEFRRQLGALPRNLSSAADAYRTVAAALKDYCVDLEARQRRADLLETRARDLVDRSRPAADSAAARILDDQLAEVRRQAWALHGDRSAARSATARITGIPQPPYRKPSWWDRFKGWIRRNRDGLRSLSSKLKIVAGVCAVIGLIPGLQPFAMAAQLLAGAALLVDGMLVVAGEASWTSVAIDAVEIGLGTRTGAQLVRLIPGVGRILDAAGDVVGRLFTGLRNQSRAVAAERLAELLPAGPGDAPFDPELILRAQERMRQARRYVSGPAASDEFREQVALRRARASLRYPDLDGKALAQRVPDGERLAVYESLGTDDRLAALWDRDYGYLDWINKENITTELLTHGTGLAASGRPSYLVNCSYCVLEADRALASGGRTLLRAPPFGETTGIPYLNMRPEDMGPDLYRALLVEPTGVATVDDVVREMTAAGPGSRAIFSYGRSAAQGHMVNAVNDHNGVVLIDSQAAGFAALEDFTGGMLVFTARGG